MTAVVPDKTERLMNLIALLLETRRPLTPDEIRRKVPGYGGSDVAFRRMFERDKEEIRDLGIPLEKVGTDVWEVEEGYMIRPEHAMISDVDFTLDERAALMIAAQAWQGEAVPADPQRALMKLSFASADAAEPEPGWLRARVDASTPVLEPIFDAIARRKRVTFTYRSRGGGGPEERTVDPYALRYRGAWYLAGFDHGRNEMRHFKLDRIEGKVRAGKEGDFDPPSDVDAGIPRGPWDVEGGEEARVAFAPDTAWWVERRTGARRVSERDDGWVELAFRPSDREMFASWILGFASDAVVEEPSELRSIVIERLTRASRAAG
jgi:proteasome accessory factor B